MAHVPVLLTEVMDVLKPRSGGLYVDGTFGAGGYSRAVLGVEGARVIGIDRDPGAGAMAAQMKQAFPGRFAFQSGPFSLMEDILALSDASGVDGVMLDLGVSSMQIDEAERGFSFQKDGPLDMRMSRSGPGAADAVNHLDAEELAAIFYVYGEERHSRRAARAIVEARSDKPFERTLELAELLARVIGGKPGRIHPATRVFQALRIYVNDELGELTRALCAAERVLRPAGVLAVVTFHSLEDRIVKTFLRARAGMTGQGSRHAPEVQKGPEPSFALLTRKAVEPSDAEIAANPRARSSRLRAASRTTHPAWPADADGLPGVPPYSRLLECVS
ncbi:MAG: 16S rRNA (cytosine(1402)-N(4))-methyltransferase RsmH [Glycocaulis sp.]